MLVGMELLIPSSGRVTAVHVGFDGATINIRLSDWRTLTAPLGWYPRLSSASASERAEWRLVGRGAGIHWPSIDEDISVDPLHAGRRSQEAPASFEHWLVGRGCLGSLRRAEPT